MTPQILSNIIGGVAVILLGLIGRGLLGLRNDVRRFMREHLWLLATTLWTRDKVMQIMTKLDLPVTDPPPEDLPWKGNKQ